VQVCKSKKSLFLFGAKAEKIRERDCQKEEGQKGGLSFSLINDADRADRADHLLAHSPSKGLLCNCTNVTALHTILY
jgi:hypothetical protein